MCAHKHSMCFQIDGHFMYVGFSAGSTSQASIVSSTLFTRLPSFHLPFPPLLPLQTTVVTDVYHKGAHEPGTGSHFNFWPSNTSRRSGNRRFRWSLGRRSRIRLPRISRPGKSTTVSVPGCNSSVRSGATSASDLGMSLRTVSLGMCCKRVDVHSLFGWVVRRKDCSSFCSLLSW